MTFLRALGIAVCSGLLVALVGACGGSEKSAASSDAGVATATQGVEPAVSESDQPGSASEILAAMQKAVLAKDTVHMEMDFGSTMTFSADVNYADTGVEMDVTVTMGPMEQHLVMVDDAVYVRQFNGDGYMKVDAGAFGLGAIVDRLDSFDPKSSIGQMSDALAELEELEPETIDGENLRRFRVHIDTSAVADQLKKLPPQAQALADMAEEGTYEMWIDAEYLLRGVKVTQAGLDLEIKISDWGKPVSITAPAEDQVVEGLDLSILENLIGEGGLDGLVPEGSLDKLLEDGSLGGLLKEGALDDLLGEGGLDELLGEDGLKGLAQE